MARSVYNQRRRRKLRKIRDAERRRMRRTGGDWKFDKSQRVRPNAQVETWEDR